MIGAIISILAGVCVFVLNAGSNQSFPPPLKYEDEKKHFSLMASGDENSRRLLIEHNLRLVSHIVRKYYSSQKFSEDLLSVGTIGLIKAVDTFDCDNGAHFATYGAKCIQNEILMYFRSQKKCANEISINETIDTDRDGNPLSYIDIIKCDDTIAEDIDTKIKAAKAIDFIKNNLTRREREIIVMRYGLSNKHALTQREAAQSLGISRSYVSRIEKAALQKICDFLN